MGFSRREVDSLTSHLLQKELGAFEHLGAGRDVRSNQKVVELLHGELDRHSEGSHEESEAAGSPSTGVADPAADAQKAAAPRERRLARLLPQLRLRLPVGSPPAAGAPGAHVELEEEHARGLRVAALGADVVAADGTEHERGGVLCATQRVRADLAQPLAVPDVGGDESAEPP